MSDAKQNPDATPDDKPQKQVGEDKGAIKGPQVTEDSMRRRSDTARGSEPETRASASRRG